MLDLAESSQPCSLRSKSLRNMLFLQSGTTVRAAKRSLSSQAGPHKSLIEECAYKRNCLADDMNLV